MTITRRRLLGTLGASLLAAPALTGRARAATRLTVASLLGPDKPETRIWSVIAEAVEKRLPGAFAFRTVANAALGGERDVGEGLRLGSVQASLLTTASLSAWAPETQILDLPFLFRDHAHLMTVVGGETGARLKARLAAERFAVPAFIDYGARNLIAKAPMETPASVAGKRIRVLQSPLHAALWKAYGAYPTAIPIPETYNALQNGVVDCMDLTRPAYASLKLYEVVPVMTETRHIRASGVVAFAGAFWDGLDAAQREVFTEASVLGATAFQTLMDEEDAKATAVIEAAGGSHVEPADRADWERIGRSIWPDFAETVGGMARIEAAAAA
ncbi:MULTISPECIES: TRAP transporter substrate-binding protein [unclassified Aureimonas]|uniref:TRAP transporter substrate-binding protein n=1 Tax=unclassified Aureimonas TaxID=2615206 RepID=UPI0006FAADBC|nr:MULTISPECIES: TRAP transporter substrate-binding protein [unclassified Aureimonas]KQT69657.1 ABC transporter substrate-binding protein [Aureimonas sp. Leaf427]KQT76189.1 ABC transporter substrate-binding protein [Aureimonas sp. Leaf460]